MLYFIGLGLGDAKDITVKGLEIIRQCSRVYLEAYTSILTVGKEGLEEFYGRELLLADRDVVEQQADEILKGADVSDVAFLVVGDPFGATTHSDLVLRALSVRDPVSCHSQRLYHECAVHCGVWNDLYNFGETVSIVFWTDTWRPESFYDKIKKNRNMGLHTLCLLDIKVKEQSMENLMRGRKIYEPPRYMTVAQAAEQLLEILQNRRERGEELAMTEDTVCVGLARVGAEDQAIRSGALRELASCDLGGPLHSMIISGHLHPIEVDMLKLFSGPEGLVTLKMTDSSTYDS
ncbi:Diphthine methyl ester synthase [Triplophysa tibetana]|uniref:diphthine methyl ester synthase n=1 Tax=Triplophysa tibetana TaxID=1572043 RepID=A0A5A9NRS0_9TELE|nr:Diphthine methyl ester synthase [Triplophysa tibetana]